MIRIAAPVISQAEKDNVIQVLDSGMIACGEWVARFEQRFAAYHGTPYGIGTTSGTTALHAALSGIGVGSGDAVLVPTFTFIASVNSIVHCGAIPIFVDVEEKTFNIDPEHLPPRIQAARKAGLSPKAILIVHLFGLPCNMNAVMEIAQRYNLRVVEDCAQAHGADVAGHKVGAFGDVSAFSFYPTKNMTTGEGGIILTSSSDIEGHVRKFINHGRAGRYLHDMLGYNYRMTNIAAAIGLGQLDRLEAMNARRRSNASYLSRGLQDLTFLSVPYVPCGYGHVFHQYTLRIPNHRDQMAEWLAKHEIDSAVIYPLPVHRQPFYADQMKLEAECPVADLLAGEVLSIPVHPQLSREDLDRIIDTIRRFPLGK